MIMSEEIKNNPEELDALSSAFLQATVTDETTIAVKAEDVQNEGSGINFANHFFEPKVGSSYIIKFLPNPKGEAVTHRSAYKNLPDPDRKGKTFHYVSSGNSKTCPALELFFDLHAKGKDGDTVAKKKIEKYLSRTNQACVKIQILQSPVAEEIGMFRLFTFSTFGPNATIANLINLKVNPTKEKIAAGEEKEDIFDIFDSPVLSLSVTEANYPGKNGEPDVKGRDFTQSSWLKKNRGAFVKMPDGSIHQFTSADKVDSKITDAAKPAFMEFIKQVMNPDYDVYTYFAYKEVDDARNDKETNDYLKKVKAKVDEIIPVIRDKSLAEIANYGKKDSSANTGKEKAQTDVFKESIPDELANSVMNESSATPEASQNATEKQTTSTSGKPSVDDVLAD